MLKGNITRLKNAIDKIPKSRENVNTIMNKLKAIPQMLEEFCNAHERLVQQLKNEEEVNDAEQYRNEVVQEAEQFAEAIKVWIASESVSESASEPELELISGSEQTGEMKRQETASENSLMLLEAEGKLTSVQALEAFKEKTTT